MPIVRHWTCQNTLTYYLCRHDQMNRLRSPDRRRSGIRAQDSRTSRERRCLDPVRIRWYLSTTTHSHKLINTTFPLHPATTMISHESVDPWTLKPNTHRRRRHDSTVELSRVGGANAPVGSSGPFHNFLRCCWVASDDIVTSLLKKLSISIKIHVVKPLGVSFQIVDGIRRKSSWASCELC